MGRKTQVAAGLGLLYACNRFVRSSRSPLQDLLLLCAPFFVAGFFLARHTRTADPRPLSIKHACVALVFMWAVNFAMFALPPYTQILAKWLAGAIIGGYVAGCM